MSFTGGVPRHALRTSRSVRTSRPSTGWDRSCERHPESPAESAGHCVPAAGLVDSATRMRGRDGQPLRRFRTMTSFKFTMRGLASSRQKASSWHAASPLSARARRLAASVGRGERSRQPQCTAPLSWARRPSLKFAPGPIVFAVRGLGKLPMRRILPPRAGCAASSAGRFRFVRSTNALFPFAQGGSLGCCGARLGTFRCAASSAAR